MQATKVLAALLRVIVRSLALPGNFVDEVIFSENLVEHDLNVVRGVPVAMVVEAARLLEDSRHFHAPWTHELDIDLGGFMSILECPLLFRFAPKHFVVTVGVEWRI